MDHIYRHKGTFLLESNCEIELELKYWTEGRINQSGDNVVWICHALTGDQHASVWWSGLVGSGKVYDTSKYFVICVNVIGSCYGSTSPTSINPSTGEPYHFAFPKVTIRDIVLSFECLREELGISSIHTLVGGSFGGMQALEWAVEQPEVVKNLVVIAAIVKQSPWAIALNESQRLAIEADDTLRNIKEGCPVKSIGRKGLIAARSIAMLSYRSYVYYKNHQSGYNHQNGDLQENLLYRATTYQRYCGERLANRFCPFSYWALTKTIDSHDVGRNRLSQERALNNIKARSIVIGVSSDMLYPPEESMFMAEHIPNAVYAELNTDIGHDGFLIEIEQISSILEKFYLEAFHQFPSGHERPIDNLVPAHLPT